MAFIEVEGGAVSVEPSELRRLTIPRYSYADADRMAEASRGTSRRWTTGYQYLRPGRDRVVQPPVTQNVERHEGVSFLDLMEIVAIGKLKKVGFLLPTIRGIVITCQDVLGVSRPLVSLKFKVGGREIFVDAGSNLVEVGRRKGEQAWKEILEPFLETVDYTQETVSRWWPMGKNGPVMVDPSYGFGLPVVKNSGVRTEILLERFRAGEKMREIGEDFNLQPSDVEDAIQFELRRIAA